MFFWQKIVAPQPKFEKSLRKTNKTYLISTFWSSFKNENDLSDCSLESRRNLCRRPSRFGRKLGLPDRFHRNDFLFDIHRNLLFRFNKFGCKFQLLCCYYIYFFCNQISFVTGTSGSHIRLNFYLYFGICDRFWLSSEIGDN